jgi:hypothetical protein
VYFCSEFINHRDTENTEVAQRREIFGLLGQSRARVLSDRASDHQQFGTEYCDGDRAAEYILDTLVFTSAK